MPKLHAITTNFTAGELSPRLRGRTDIEKFNSSAELLENCVVLRQGGATIRPSRDYVGPVRHHAQAVRILPFVYSRVDSFILELGAGYMAPWLGPKDENEAVIANPALGALPKSQRVYKSATPLINPQGQPASYPTPWSEAQLPDLRYTQRGDTLIVTHPDVPPHRIVRYGEQDWRCELIPFVPAMLEETGHARTDAVSISDMTVGAGRTVTSTDAAFLASDVGRIVSWGPGRARITAVTSATTATATVLTRFASLTAAAWLIEGTPMTGITPSIKDPIGAVVTLTLDQAGWRAGDEGKFVEVNGGLVEIVSLGGLASVTTTGVVYNGGYNTDEFNYGAQGTTASQANWTTTTTVQGDPSLVATGIIRRELVGVTTAIGDSWVLKGAGWNARDGYPTACTIHQQRLWFAGTRKHPQGLWGSRTGLYFDFTPGTEDDAAVYKDIDSDDTNVIQHILNDGSLVVLTFGSEWDIRGGLEKPITQLNAQITQRSRWGAANVRPVKAGKTAVYGQRTGTALREIYRTELEGIDTRDISVYSGHLLARGIKSLAWEQTPEHVLWATTKDGDLLAITRSEENNVLAYCSGNAAGVVEWVASIPEGDTDATYCLTRYTFGGQTLRYVERLNWRAPPGQDARMSAADPVAKALWTGFAHLSGQEVAVLADGVSMGRMVVSGTGTVELERDANTVSIGLPYVATLSLPPPEIGSGIGTGQSAAQSTNQVWVRFLETTSCRLNGREIPFRRLGLAMLDLAPQPFTGVKDALEHGWKVGGDTNTLSQDLPYPWTILSVTRSITVNAG